MTGGNDYSRGDSWLCRPGRQDACAIDLTTTVISAQGHLTRENWSADRAAPVDCFYVYPTISADTTPNSGMVPGAGEKNIVSAQFARFASKCRPFAPMYRQITLAALGAEFSGKAVGDSALAYNDIRDAWQYYLAHDNNGRGVVLIGHSQGAIILAHLMQEEIDGTPVQSRIVSALLLGTRLPVPKGKDVGGAFRHIPLCRSRDQAGCVVTYASFRANLPPPADALFGTLAIYQPTLTWAAVQPADPGTTADMIAACTNPAVLSGASGALHSYFPADWSTVLLGPAANIQPWVKPPQTITTPFVSVPGMLSAECLLNEHGSYLAITVRSDSADKRATDIAGDIMANNQPLVAWGLHVIDVELTMGNLIDLVGRQSAAYLRMTRP